MTVREVFFVEEVRRVRSRSKVRDVFMTVAEAADAIKAWERDDAFALGPYKAAKIRRHIVRGVAEMLEEVSW